MAYKLHTIDCGTEFSTKIKKKKRGRRKMVELAVRESGMKVHPAFIDLDGLCIYDSESGAWRCLRVVYARYADSLMGFFLGGE